MTYVPPRAGEFRHNLTVERRVEVDDGMGGGHDDWEAIAEEVPACIRVQRGGEQVTAMRLSGISHFDIILRASPTSAGITTGDRFVGASETYDIKWTGDVEGRGRFIHFACQSGGLSDG